MSTPFAYPNGDFIDVFLENSGDMFQSLLLSDYGQTGIYLHNSQVEMEASKRRRQLVEDMAAELGVSLHKGQLQVELPPSENPNLSDAIFRLSQACVKIADLAYHARLASVLPLKEEVWDYLKDGFGVIKRDEMITGKYGRDIKVDFSVRAANTSYLLTLAARSAASLHARSNEIYSKWTSIQESAQLITVIDPRSINGIRGDDKKRLEAHSHIVVYPDGRDQMGDLLRRAS
jgi:hypothetical protein